MLTDPKSNPSWAQITSAAACKSQNEELRRQFRDCYAVKPNSYHKRCQSPNFHHWKYALVLNPHGSTHHWRPQFGLQAKQQSRSPTIDEPAAKCQNASRNLCQTLYEAHFAEPAYAKQYSNKCWRGAKAHNARNPQQPKRTRKKCLRLISKHYAQRHAFKKDIKMKCNLLALSLTRRVRNRHPEILARAIKTNRDESRKIFSRGMAQYKIRRHKNGH